MQRVIKDIARLAGVSVTTVSRALNDAPEIHSETRDKVLRVCREQGYRANLLARSLSSSRSNLLGLVVSDMANPFHAALALNIQLCAQEAGYQLMFCSSRREGGRLEELFDFLYSQRVDGILLSSSSDGAYDLARRSMGKVPCILLGACAPEESPLRANTVSVDNYAGGRMAAKYLHSQGHRDVALGFIQVADELGAAIPDRLSILGFDSIEYTALPNIRLTTFSQNTPRLAQAAVRLLLELIDNGDQGEYTRKLITPILIQRATCRAVEQAGRA